MKSQSQKVFRLLNPQGSQQTIWEKSIYKYVYDLLRHLIFNINVSFLNYVFWRLKLLINSYFIILIVVLVKKNVLWKNKKCDSMIIYIKKNICHICVPLASKSSKPPWFTESLV